MPIDHVPVEGKFIIFQPLVAGEKIKTKVWSVWGRGTNTHLGFVKFRPQWRCYIFMPDEGTGFDFKCLQDLKDFLEQQNQAWRKGLREGR